MAARQARVRSHFDLNDHGMLGSENRGNFTGYGTNNRIHNLLTVYKLSAVRNPLGIRKFRIFRFFGPLIGVYYCFNI